MLNNQETIMFILGRRDQRMTRVSFRKNDTKRAIKLFNKNTADNVSAENYLILLDNGYLNILAKSPTAKEFYLFNGKLKPFYKKIANLDKFLYSHTGLYNIYISGSGNTCVAYPIIKTKEIQEAFIYHRVDRESSWSPSMLGDEINYDLYNKSNRGRTFKFS